MLKLKICKVADKDHKESLRQYAHVYHKKDVICVAPSFFRLPLEHQTGLIAHEVGHLLAGESEDREYKADEAANSFFKIKIKYKDSPYGERLQYLTVKESRNVLDWMFFNVIVE